MQKERFQHNDNQKHCIPSLTVKSSTFPLCNIPQNLSLLSNFIYVVIKSCMYHQTFATQLEGEVFEIENTCLTERFCIDDDKVAVRTGAFRFDLEAWFILSSPS